MTFFFFLPSMLLSGFMFPFRGIVLKGKAVAQRRDHNWPILLFIAAVLAVGLKTFRRTLD